MIKIKKISSNAIKKSSKRIISGVLCLVIIFSLTSCTGLSLFDNQEAVQNKFNEYCNRLFVETLSDDAMSAHFKISNPSDYGISFSDEDYTLGDASVEKYEENISSANADIEELKEINRDLLTSQQKITYDTLMNYLETQLSFSGSGYIQNLFSPGSGIASNLSTIFTEFTFYNKDDVDHYLLLLKDVKRYIDDSLKVVDKQAEKKYFVCDKIADKIIEECDGYYDNKGEDIIKAFKDKLNALELTLSEKEKYIDTQKEYIEKYYVPSYKAISDKFKSLKGKGVNEGGLCNFGEAGKKYYSALVKYNTSSSMTPNQMVTYIENHISTMLKQMVNASYEDYRSSLDYEPDFADADEILEFLVEKTKTSFPQPATTSYTVENMNESDQNGITAAYYIRSRIDDTSVNTIKVNSKNMEDDSLSLYTTLAHESYPGHLYQITGFYSNKNITNLRKILDFLGATEGWAQYAKNSAIDYLDVNESVKNLIKINEELTYALMARVDVGVNYEGWTLKDTYKYLSKYITVDDDFENEDNVPANFYYTAIGNVGEYLPYAVGYMKMADLRDKAEKKLADKFDEKKFHKWVMDSGITSFDVYEPLLDEWINNEKSTKDK